MMRRFLPAIVVAALFLLGAGVAVTSMPGGGRDDDAGSADATEGASSAAGAAAQSDGAHSSEAPGRGESTSELQPGAEEMEVAILSPVDGSSVSSNEIRLNVAPLGFDPACDLVGKGTQAGQGHYHLYRDGTLVDFFCTPATSISMRNLEPGEHTFEVVPAQNDHTEITANSEAVTINWQPVSPPPVIQPANFRQEPSIKIISPRDDATARRGLDLVLDVKSFNLSCDLMGNSPVDGYGHWHIKLAGGSDERHGTLLAMGCSERVRISTKGLQSGSIYSIVVELTDNLHSPLGISDEIDIRVR